VDTVKRLIRPLFVLTVFLALVLIGLRDRAVRIYVAPWSWEQLVTFALIELGLVWGCYYMVKFRGHDIRSGILAFLGMSMVWVFLITLVHF
jgi:hypothetical protein